MAFGDARKRLTTHGEKPTWLFGLTFQRNLIVGRFAGASCNPIRLFKASRLFPGPARACAGMLSCNLAVNRNGLARLAFGAFLQRYATSVSGAH
jgi:hypothetical protein